VNPADAVTKSRLLAMLEDVAGSLDEHCSAPLEPEPFSTSMSWCHHLSDQSPLEIGEPTLFVEVIDEPPVHEGYSDAVFQLPAPSGCRWPRQELLAPAGIDDKLL
jgi:hypothetical protein